MIEIGAGGGSIAEADDRGLIQVGPRSAGADPGPACYAQGGTLATLTDANVVLGYLDPDFFLGGEMALDAAAAEAAVTEHVAQPLGLSLTRAAWGIHEIIDEDVARAFRIHASERGFDYRGCSMVAFGGSGPVHAAGVARKLRIPRVVFPLAAGVMSAFGLLVSPLSFEVLRSNLVFLDDLGDDWVEQYLRLPVDEACGHLRAAGVPEDQIRLSLRLDMRYHGQGHEIEVELPTDGDPGLGGVAGLRPRLQGLFEARYSEIFADVLLEEVLEIMNWKVEARGPETAAAAGYEIASASAEASAKEDARKGARRAYFPEGRRLRRGRHLRPHGLGAGRRDPRPGPDRGARIDLRHRPRRLGLRGCAPQRYPRARRRSHRSSSGIIWTTEAPRHGDIPLAGRINPAHRVGLGVRHRVRLRLRHDLQGRYASHQTGQPEWRFGGSRLSN